MFLMTRSYILSYFQDRYVDLLRLLSPPASIISVINLSYFKVRTGVFACNHYQNAVNIALLVSHVTVVSESDQGKHFF